MAVHCFVCPPALRMWSGWLADISNFEFRQFFYLKKNLYSCFLMLYLTFEGLILFHKDNFSGVSSL